METLLLYILSDKGLFAAFLGAIIGGIFAIVGSLIGGVFTYLAVILTLNHQKKNEYPQKLLTLVEMLSLVEGNQEELVKGFDFVDNAPSNVLRGVNIVEIKKLEESLILKAVTVDKNTYVVISTFFSSYVKSGYSESIRIYSKAPEEVKHAKRFQKELTKLHQEIDNRIKYYSKRIK